MESTSKHRTPSRCREWERQRRNKFNDAITKLGEIVKTINNASDPTGKGTDNVQYPKIEIVQKAILCLNNCTQEKTQLKAEILALQVKLEGQNINKKDASTQVQIGINKKIKNGKYVKLLMLQKSKRNKLKEKSIPANSNVKSKTEIKKVTVKKCIKQNASMQKLPILLPRCNLINKKAPENTIVVLPATPYIFPQRPLLFPSVPPAFVLVDPHMQTLNKTVPIVSRNGGDITKTTMVNILPISAYSCPLSATKTRKNNLKLKTDGKKTIKKSKPIENVSKESTKRNDTQKLQTGEQPVTENKRNVSSSADSNKINEETIQSQKELESIKDPVKEPIATNGYKTTLTTADNSKNSNDTSVQNDSIKKPSRISNKTMNTDVVECTESVIVEKPSSAPISSLIEVNTTDNSTKPNNQNTKTGKMSPVKVTKDSISGDKDKGNKLPNILETTLCDHAVEAGNAPLELAEEFLAASPTAAFLMSFPLVSGNRADSPAEEPQNTVHPNTKDNNLRRNEIMPQHTATTIPYFDKHINSDIKTKTSKLASTITLNKPIEQQKFIENMISKHVEPKIRNSTTLCSVSNENPFLNLPMPSLISTNFTLADTAFGLDFDCNTTKPTPSQSTSYTSNSNLFYKSDPFSTVKSAIYSTSSISSNHEFNGLGLYPCAMEKYTSKNKSDYANVEDNLMKIGSSRLTYDIDLGWSHKSLDFANCTTSSSTFKDNILTTASAPYCTSYNPFNPEFHTPLVSNSNRKENVPNKPSSSFAETITSFYSQPSNLWTEDVPFYSNSNMTKVLTAKHQNYLPVDQVQSNTNVKQNNGKQYEKHQNTEAVVDNGMKSTNIGVGQQISEKYTKKSPNKMHINWMTSEIRPMQNNCNPLHTDMKEAHKLSYSHLDQAAKKPDNSESNYFPISMHNFPTQTAQEEFQMWPSTRTLGTTEISIDPPPVNLPTLVGDLALGPHDKKKNADAVNRAVPQGDVQNFLSVTQLMNRSTDMSSRYQAQNNDVPKSIPMKQNIVHNTADSNRKILTSRMETHVPQPYIYNDPKLINPYENVPFTQNKNKTNSKSEKSSKAQKINYSAEALIRSGSYTQRAQDSGSAKFIMPPPQKYNDFNAPQDSSVAQISHFPPIIDYSDNTYAGQQFSGTSLYNTTTNTISNSFYSNFMPGSTNLMSSNYTSAPFTGDFIDYNQSTECNYNNHKYEEVKVKNNPVIFQTTDKVPSSYKSSRRESAAKHKLECSKKESSKKIQNKKSKLNSEVEEWGDPSYLLWQNKASSNKRHSNLMPEELSFPNYVTNQMPTQYQPDFFNSHLMPSNVQSVGHVDRSLSTFPATSRANFNLSTIFPEITMKVQ